MDSKRLADRINALVAKTLATQDPAELEKVIAQLRKALSEHTQRLRKMAASKLPVARRRKNDQTR